MLFRSRFPVADMDFIDADGLDVGGGDSGKPMLEVSFFQFLDGMPAQMEIVRDRVDAHVLTKLDDCSFQRFRQRRLRMGKKRYMLHLPSVAMMTIQTMNGIEKMDFPAVSQRLAANVSNTLKFFGDLCRPALRTVLDRPPQGDLHFAQ